MLGLKLKALVDLAMEIIYSYPSPPYDWLASGHNGDDDDQMKSSTVCLTMLDGDSNLLNKRQRLRRGAVS